MSSRLFDSWLKEAACLQSARAMGPSCYSSVHVKHTVLPWAPAQAWPCGDSRKHVCHCTCPGVFCDPLWKVNQPLSEVQGLFLVIFDQVFNSVVWCGCSDGFREGSLEPRGGQHMHRGDTRIDEKRK